MSAAYRVFDIETVVDDRFWTRPPMKWEMTPVVADYVATPDGRLVYRSSVENQQWVYNEPFPPPQAHRVVSISWVDLSGDDDAWYSLVDAQTRSMWSHGEEAADNIEKGLLEDFGTLQANDKATMVTWNGRGFDLPVINLRSFLHNVACGWYYEDRDVRYRYSEAGHCDLMDVFSDYGAVRQMKLGDVARLAGLPGKVGPVSGANVVDFYNKGDYVDDMAAVGKYCLGDSLQTALLFAKSRLHRGMISLSHYNDVVVPSFLPELERVLGVKKGDLR